LIGTKIHNFATVFETIGEKRKWRIIILSENFAGIATGTQKVVGGMWVLETTI